LAEQAGEFLLDEFQPAAVGKLFFLEQPGELGLGTELGLGLLVHFDVHHLFNQLYDRVGVHTSWGLASNKRARPGAGTCRGEKTLTSGLDVEIGFEALIVWRVHS